MKCALASVALQNNPFCIEGIYTALTLPEPPDLAPHFDHHQQAEYIDKTDN